MPIYMNPIFRQQPSVYVISDSELKRYKEHQLKQEIFTLERMIQQHCDQISQLNDTITILKKDLPNTETSSTECDT